MSGVDAPSTADILAAARRALGEAFPTVRLANWMQLGHPYSVDLYGEKVAVKVEACLAVTDSAYDAGLAALARYREQAEEALAGIDVLLTPTLPCVAPPRCD